MNRLAIRLALLCLMTLSSTAVAGETGDGEARGVTTLLGPGDTLPRPEHQRVIQPYLKDLAPGKKLSVTVTYNFMYDRHFVERIAAVTDKGVLDGNELLYTIGIDQPTRIVPWKNGKREGIERIWKGDHRGVTLEKEITWVNDVTHGPVRTLFPDGSVRTLVNYVNGRVEGPTVSYDEKGNVTRSAAMKGGLREGLMTDFFPASKQPKRMVPYKAGKVEGLVREFYLNGKLKKEIAFLNDLMHGAEKLYDAEGTLTATRWWLEGESVSKTDFDNKSGK